MKWDFWVATVNADLEFAMPVQKGSKTRPTNEYSPKQEAALRKAMLLRFHDLAKMYPVDLNVCMALEDAVEQWI